MKFTNYYFLYFVNILILLLFLLNPHKSSGNNVNEYYFKTTEEGIFKIVNPFPKETISDNIFVLSENHCYKPYYNKKDNYIYVYSKTATTYRLICTISKDKQTALKNHIENFQSINKKEVYKYSLSIPREMGNWIHGNLRGDSLYQETIWVGKKIHYDVDTCNVFLYNFSNEKTVFSVSLNDVTSDTSITGEGIHKMKFPFTTSDGFLTIKVYSPFADLGIVKYEYSIIDKKIAYCRPFEKYTYNANAKPEFQINSQYEYFYLSETSLIYLGNSEKTNLELSNLIVVSSKAIKPLYIHTIQKPDTTHSDYLIITHHSLLKQSKELVLLLKDQHPAMTFKLLDVQSIYDQYSLSHPSSFAIKKYLHQINPKFVLLIGDTNVKEESKRNLIPSNYYYQAEKNTRIPTDYIYCYQTNPALPIFSIGRLPVSTEKELKNYISKLKIYLKVPNQNKPLIYDSENLIDTVLYNTSSITYYDTNDKFNIAKLQQTINIYKPNTLIYLGHGSFHGWKKTRKIDIDDFYKIRKNYTFLLIDLSCWTGEFSHRNSDAYSEKLLKLHKKGPVTIISSSGYTFSQNTYHLLNYYFNSSHNPIGEFLNTSKKELFTKNLLDIDDLHSLNLLGIPSL